MKYKVGDKVKLRSDLKDDICYFDEGKNDYWFYSTSQQIFVEENGTVLTIVGIEGYCYLVDGFEHAWWMDDMFEGLYEEPKPTEDYSKACWYCRKGGVVDIYLNGDMGICPHCGRVCNDRVCY